MEFLRYLPNQVTLGHRSDTTVDGHNSLSRLTGVGLSSYDLDGPFPREVIDADLERSEGSRFRLVLDIVEREQPTLRQLCHRLAGARGHRVVTGTPDQVADTIQEWAEKGAADGFNVMPPWLPRGIDVFIEKETA